MSAVLRVPSKRSACIQVAREGQAWLVLAGNGHSWLHGSFRSAMRDAHWLSQNLGLPIRSAAA
jgi:hypothetical protein